MDVFFETEGLTGLIVEDQARTCDWSGEYLPDGDGSQEHNRCPL